jgi:DNA-binding transcriptional LysR family regulator
MQSRLRLLDLDSLYILQHLLAGGTVGSAAKMLGITQPAVSQRVRTMEHVFGGDILHRLGRTSYLTGLGVQVAYGIKESLEIIERTFNDIHQG